MGGRRRAEPSLEPVAGEEGRDGDTVVALKDVDVLLLVDSRAVDSTADPLCSW